MGRRSGGSRRRFGDHHRNVQGGAARAAVFGVSDGLVSNVSLILGVAGAGADADVVRVAGLAGLLAGAFSMAAGEYISVKAHSELLQRELSRERRQHEEDPDREQLELAEIFEERGLSEESAATVAAQIMRDPEAAIEVHAREEMGIDPSQLGSPGQASLSSFGAFAAGAAVPLLPWAVLGGTAAVAVSIVVGAAAALGVGWTMGVITERPRWFAALRQLAIGAAAGAVTYGVGAVLGVQAG
jgi:VIT1/CCC1 family predicted Fe2+/Mn2+ transporter